MRVTNSLMSRNYLRNLNRQTERVHKYQNQLASLKEVSRPSDDPMAVSKILDLKNSITQNEQYLGAIEDMIDWTDMQDSALSQATKSLQRIQTLIQSAVNGTMNDDSRQAIKNEINGEIESLTDALNTNFGGRYIFSGHNTTTKPFEVIYSEEGEFAGIEYHGTSDNLTREVSPKVNVDLFANGNELMEFQAGDDLGTFFKDVLEALDNDDMEALSGDLLEKADRLIDNTVNIRTKIGATSNRLEAAKERNENEKINLKSMLSNKEDVDLAEKYMEFTMEMTAYQSSLYMGTQILQTNILNYL